MRGAAVSLVVVGALLSIGFLAAGTYREVGAGPGAPGFRVTVTDDSPSAFSRPILRLVPLPDGAAGASVRAVERSGAKGAARVELTALEPMIARGLRVLPVVISPGSEPGGASSVALDVTVRGPIAPETSAARAHGRAFFEALRGALPAEGPLSIEAASEGSYLVVTAPDFRSAIEPLARWKREKGLRVSVVTTSETGADRTQIREYIRTQYRTAEVPPEYVLLVGDVETVPAFDIGGNVSDLPYSLTDGDDFLPDLFIGRLSVRNVPQAETIVAKILRHERDPYLDDGGQWMGRGLVVGGDYGSSTPVPVSRWCRQEMFASGFTRVDSVYYPPHFGSGTPLIAGILNQGVSLVTYRGWAYGIEGWDRPTFLSRNIPGLTNGWKLPVVFSFVCLNNRFDENECFGEAWIRAGTATDPKGAVAFIGNGEHWSHTRFNDAMAIGTFTGIRQGGLRRLGDILLSAKLNLLSQFPLEILYETEASESVEFYFYIYNLLGDPEMDLCVGPARAIAVSHPASVATGANFIEVRVTEAAGAPVEGARVGLSRDGEWLGCSWTDASGIAHVETDLGASAQSLTIRVTGANVAPYAGSVSIAQAGSPFLAPSEVVVVDDGSGSSLGNGDGVANPGETVELHVSLRNDGASGVPAAAAILSAPSGAEIVQGTASYTAIPAGTTRAPLVPHVVRLERGVEDGLALRFGLRAYSGADTSASVVTVAVAAPSLRHASSIVDGDGVLAAGETGELSITVRNDGSVAADAVTALLRSGDASLAVVVDSTAIFGSIAPGASAVGTGPLVIRAAAGAPAGQAATFTLVLTTAGGAVQLTSFSVPIGAADITAPLGPDGYGYWAYDCTDTEYPSGVPEYEWITCSTLFGGSGTRLTIRDNQEVVVSLPFSFTFYGVSYNAILVSDNGWISFDLSQYYDFYNWTMPNVYGSGAQVAAFWDNLDPAKTLPCSTPPCPPVGDGVYTYNDAVRHAFVIEWSRQGNADQPATPPQQPVRFDDLQTFEIVLFDPAYHTTPTGDGIIQIQYKQIANVDRGRMYATVGIENETEDDGIQYTYSNLYAAQAAPLSSGLAIRFTTEPPVFQPFRLAEFRAEPAARGVALRWAPEPGRRLSGFRLYRREAGGTFEAIASLDAGARSFMDEGAAEGALSEYEVGLIDGAGREIRVGPYAIGAGAPVPREPRLRATAAIPAGEGIAFTADLPQRGKASLRVYDVAGRLVRAFERGGEAGTWPVRWDGRDVKGRRMPAGIYLARLEAPGGAVTIKTALIR